MNLVLLGWLRPVRARNADNMVRLRPSCPTARSERRISDSAVRSSRNEATAGAHAPCLGKFPHRDRACRCLAWAMECYCGQPSGETVGLEDSPIIDAIVGVNISNELILDIWPMPLSADQASWIDRNAVPLHASSRRHVPASQ